MCCAETARVSSGHSLLTGSVGQRGAADVSDARPPLRFIIATSGRHFVAARVTARAVRALPYLLSHTLAAEHCRLSDVTALLLPHIGITRENPRAGSFPAREVLSSGHSGRPAWLALEHGLHVCHELPQQAAIEQPHGAQVGERTTAGHDQEPRKAAERVDKRCVQK